MKTFRSKEVEKWMEVKKGVGNETMLLGPIYSYYLKSLPRRLLFALSRYKFAAKMLGDGKNVLEVGCSEGFGTMVLAENAAKVVGIDIDRDALSFAEQNLANEKIEFKNINILDAKIGKFDGVVALDVVEHIYEENEETFFASLCDHLTEHGICIIGTPNKTAENYASEVSRIGHINLYDWNRLKTVMEKYFHNVFLFSANDEVVHTGFYPMAHYLIAMGVGKK